MLLSLASIVMQTILAPNFLEFIFGRYFSFWCLLKNIFFVYRNFLLLHKLKNKDDLTFASHFHTMGLCWAKPNYPSYFNWPITIGEGSLCLVKHSSFVCLKTVFAPSTAVPCSPFCKEEQDAAEFGANSDANRTCTKFSWFFFLPDILLFDANERICFFWGISYFCINSKTKTTLTLPVIDRPGVAGAVLQTAS